MRSATTPPRLKAEQPGDLLALMPYLLGYHPDESLVMTVVADRRLGVCVRVDLTGDPQPIADRFAEIARANAADGVILIAYSADPGRADRHLAVAMTELAGVGVIEALYVDGRRWWSRSCTEQCCPPEGTAYEIDSNRLAAEAVFAGMSTAGSRADIEKLVTGPDAAATERLDPMVERIAHEAFVLPVAERRRRLRCWVEDYVRRRRRGEQPTPSEEDLLRLACLVLDLLVRDEAWSLITRPTAEFHVELWQRVVATAASPLEPGPLCLLGMAAWAAGHGTLQVCCLERVREVDPTYTMGDLLSDINLRALPPVVWDQVRPEFQQTLAEQAATAERAGPPPGRQPDGNRSELPDWGEPWTPRPRRRISRAARRRSSRGSRRRALGAITDGRGPEAPGGR